MKNSFSFLIISFLLVIISCEKQPNDPDDETNISKTDIDKPLLLSPTDGSSPSDMESVIFKWIKVDNAVKYQIMFDWFSSREELFESPVLNEITNSTSFKPQGHDWRTRSYHWRVRAQDAENNLSEWSDVWSFTPSPSAGPPATPKLKYPPDGSSIEILTPTFEWDDVSRAVSYDLALNDTDDINNAKLILEELSSSSYQFDDEIKPATYYWSVRCRDENGLVSEWASAFQFTIIEPDSTENIEGWLIGNWKYEATVWDNNLNQYLTFIDELTFQSEGKVTHTEQYFYANGDFYFGVYDEGAYQFEYIGYDRMLHNHYTYHIKPYETFVPTEHAYFYWNFDGRDLLQLKRYSSYFPYEWWTYDRIF